MNIGEKIKHSRKKAGLTQKELAENLGVSAAMIAQYETGKRNPKFETIKKIAKALNIEPHTLLPNADYNRALGDKALTAYSVILEQIIGLKGYTFGITEDDDSLYINYPDGILKVSLDITEDLQENIESYTEFKMQELKKKYSDYFIPKKYFDFINRVTKPEYQKEEE